MAVGSRGGAWTSYGKGRGRDRLKHLGSRRGAGVVLSADLSTPVAYELDVYSLGATRTVQGSLDGDFSAFLPEGETELARLEGAQLRLEDGRLVDIELIDLEPAFAAFEASGASVSDDLLPT